MPAPVFKSAPQATAQPIPSVTIDGVPVWSLHDELLPVTDLQTRVHPQNDNNHDETQTLLLANILRKQGVRRSILLSKLTGRIVAGHGALKAAGLAGMSCFPVMWQEFESEAAELAHLMADNEIARLGERDHAQAAVNLDILQGAGFDLTLTGIMEGDRMDLLDLLSPEIPGQAATPTKGKKGVAQVNSIEELDETLPGAQSLKADMIFMPSTGFEVDVFDIPKLRLDMCLTLPAPIDSWAGPDATTTKDDPEMHFLYNITSVMRELPFDRSIFGFYADDHRFEVVWNQPAKYAAKLLNGGFMGAVTPNFSIHYGAPKVAHLWNIYRSRWVGRYFQEAGIKIIPDVPISGWPSMEYVLAGIPKGVPAICIQCQTADKNPQEMAVRKALYAEIEKRLEPQDILIYCGDHVEEMLKGVFKHATPHFILNRMQKRREVIRKNASGAAKMK